MKVKVNIYKIILECLSKADLTKLTTGRILSYSLTLIMRMKISVTDY